MVEGEGLGALVKDQDTGQKPTAVSPYQSLLTARTTGT